MVQIVETRNGFTNTTGGKNYYQSGRLRSYVGMFQLVIRAEETTYPSGSWRPVDWSRGTPEAAGFEVFTFYSTMTNLHPTQYRYVQVYTRTIEQDAPELYIPHTNRHFIIETIFDEAMSYVDGAHAYPNQDHIANFDPVSTRAGDYVFALTEDNKERVTYLDKAPAVPEGYTEISSALQDNHQHMFSWAQTDINGYTVPPAILNSHRYSYVVHATISLRPVGHVGFQIKHNGALIPATPHLWSGGQLTPVTLKRPE